MKPWWRDHWSPQNVSFLSLLPITLGCWLAGGPWPARAGGVVTDCTEAALRTAMIGGGLVTFTCDGTITLTNTLTVSEDTVLDATGRQVTISGG